MQYRYGEYDGHPFPTQDSLFPSPEIVNFILQYGDEAMDAMENMDDEVYQQYVQAMIDAGLLEEDPETGKLRMTPRMVRGIEHRALLDIFHGLDRGVKEGHTSEHAGRGDERVEGTRPYQFGDPVSELDVHATMRNALRRQVAEAQSEPPFLPLHVTMDDFELHHTESQTDVAMCILIDMSGSMMRWGRFFQAKRVALGMSALMRRHFPQDTVDYAGFYSLATPIRESDLPLVMPKPVSLYDPVVRLRMPLEQAQQKEDRLPLHFTNLQLGLRTARQLLSRRGAANKQIFIITDGQPTAHVDANPHTGEEMLYLLYPPTEETSTITLKEALRCQQQGIGISTFALVEDYYGMDWVGFIDQLTRLTRGTAFYCSSDDLSSTVIESYLNGKRKKSFIK